MRQLRSGRALSCATSGQRPRALALSADGATVAATLSDDSVAVWRLPDGAKRRGAADDI